MSASAPQLKADIQSIIDDLLDGQDIASRQAALDLLVNANAADKQQAETYLLAGLDKTQNWGRTWTLTALAKTNLPAGRKTVIDHIDASNEPNAWARHFAILNAATFAPFPETEIEAAANDLDPLVKATAMRSLLGQGNDQFADDLLQMLDDRNHQGARWAACRALRIRPEMVRLRKSIEAKFIQPLTEIAANRYLWADARWEAVQALQGVLYHQAEAARALSEVLMKHREANEATHRRSCLDAIQVLAQPETSQEALLRALDDDDAEIRVRAATVLKNFIGDERALQLIIDCALDEKKQGTRFFVDALRLINADRAAEVLSQALLSPEQTVADSAAKMLEVLGGQAAARMLQAQRTLVLKTNSDLLSQAEGDVQKQLAGLITQANLGFQVSMVMHVTIFVIGVIVLGGSAYLVFGEGYEEVQRWVGAAGGAGALTTLLLLFYRNPLQNIRTSVSALMEVDVIFRGYVRQLNQIDATFKHMFLGGNSFGTSQMKETVEQIQSTVKTTLELVKNNEAVSAGKDQAPANGNGRGSVTK